MGKVQWFKDYLVQVQAEIPEVKKNYVVIEKDQLTKFLAAHDSLDNTMIVGVLPDFSGKGDHADDIKLINISQFFVLDKTTFSEYDHDEFIDIYEKTYLVLEKVLKKLLNDSQSCTELRFLDVNSIKIEPVFNMDSCNGWKLMFNFDMFV